MSSKQLMKFLTSPAKVASSLDWKKLDGSVLAVNIGRDQIGAVLGSHPSSGKPVRILEPIEMKLEKRGNNQLSPDWKVLDDLQDIVRQHQVCGFVVTWPVQKDGHCGAPCGRALHTLDWLVASSSSILTRNRLFCLWDVEHVTPSEDEWGRCPAFGQPSMKTMHVASLEQYGHGHDCSSTAVVPTWEDFCRSHWPELHQENDFCDREYLATGSYEKDNRAQMQEFVAL